MNSATAQPVAAEVAVEEASQVLQRFEAQEAVTTESEQLGPAALPAPVPVLKAPEPGLSLLAEQLENHWLLLPSLL